MAITVKYNASSEARALKKNNIWIGIDGEKGPTENTGFWSGIPPITNGWTIYNRRGESELFDIYTASNDDLVYKTNWIFGTTFSTNGECQIHYAGSVDRMVLRREPSNITTEGLVLFLDPNFSASYPADGSTFYDMSGVGGDATLLGSPTFEENSDSTNSIVLNGENQTLDLFGNFSGSINSVFTWIGWYYVDNPSKSGRQVLFGNRESGTDPGFCICVNSLEENDNLFYVEWYDEDYGSLTHESITPGSWIFGAFTANRGGQGSLWINDSRVSGTIGNFDLTTILNSGKWFIGGDTNYLFKGKVGLNVLYSRILSVDEVNTIYQTTRTIYDPQPEPENNTTTTTTSTTTVVSGYTPLILEYEVTLGQNDTAIPLIPNLQYDFVIDWGDGESDNISGLGSDFLGQFGEPGLVTHRYDDEFGDQVPGIYSVQITSTLPFSLRHVSENGTIRGSHFDLKKVTQWGNCPWYSLEQAFANCYNLQVTATDTPNLTGCLSFRETFNNCSPLTGTNFENWDLSGASASDFSFMFVQCDNFNANLNSWDMSKATNLSGMFFLASIFNQPLNDWNVSGVTNFSSMFRFSSFNQPLNNWNVCAATNMLGMFSSTPFDQDISSWKVPEIAEKPAFGFDSNAGTWTEEEKPQWGVACP